MSWLIRTKFLPNIHIITSKCGFYIYDVLMHCCFLSKGKENYAEDNVIFNKQEANETRCKAW